MRWRRILLTSGIVVVVWFVATQGYRRWVDQRRDAVWKTCRTAREAKRWEDLELTALNWAAWDDHSAEPFLFAAEAAVARQALDRAAAHLDNIPDDSPKAVAALLHRVDMLFGDLARPREAAATCERILAIDPTCGPALRRLIFFCAVTLQRTRVAALARQAIAVGADIPETYIYLIGSDWLTLSNTKDVNEQWLARRSRDEAPEHHDHDDEELFLVAATMGDLSTHGVEESPEQSVASEASPATSNRNDSRHARSARLRDLFERFPTNPELLAYFLQLASTAGDIPEVARLLATVPSGRRDDNRFWRFKGWLHAASDQLEPAEEAYREALARNPFDFASRHQLAAVLRKRGQTDSAVCEAAIAAEGKRLRRAILEQPDVGSIPATTLTRICGFIRECGEAGIADKLAGRMRQ